MSNTWIFENNYYVKFNKQEWKMMLSWRNQYTIQPFTWITWRKQRKHLYVWDSSVQIQIDWLRQWIIYVTIMPTFAESQNLKTMENMNNLNWVWNFHIFFLTKPFLMYASYIPATFQFLDFLMKWTHVTFRALLVATIYTFWKSAFSLKYWFN